PTNMRGTGPDRVAETGIRRGAGALVWFVDHMPAEEWVCGEHAPHDIGTPIGAAIIDQEQREVKVTLRSQGHERGRDARGLVEEGHDDPQVRAGVALACT